MQLPEAFLDSLIGIKGFDKEAFEKVHASSEQVTSIRINASKPLTQFTIKLINPRLNDSVGQELTKIPWSEFGYYLKERPSFTFDPLFHAGCYYVQEASSMFLEQALKQTVDLSKPLKVLDLCAAPGGKSTHIQSLISKDSLLVSNEVIRSRANVLKNNIVKWGCSNVVVTNNDPKDFSKLENYFDVIVVDAPCSGSGLFRREPEAIDEWSLNNVALCSQRQQRILADVWPALKKNGVLIYSTCSYSKEEDEEIAEWLMKELIIDNVAHPDSIGEELIINSGWGMVYTNGGYRCWPDKVKGEGFFLACFRKTDGEENTAFKTKNKKELVSNKELGIIEKWVRNEGQQFIRHNNTVYAWPHYLADNLNFLLNKLRVNYSGTIIGKLMRDKLVPEHALAMSEWVNEAIPRINVDYEQAIEYLQRKDWKLETKDKGWQLVTYKGHNLGWINVMTNRTNNYYPKELRILKES